MTVMSNETARQMRQAMAALVLALTAAACVSTKGAVPRPFPMPAGAPPAAKAPASRPAEAPGETARLEDPVMTSAPASDVAALVSSVVDTALSLRGVPYRNGGSDPTGFDCSGFTQWVFSRHTLVLPREVKDQFAVGEKVKRQDLRPGDLLFFATTSRQVSHVAIALDGDAFVHAPSTNGVVRVEHLSTEYWKKRFLGVRRVVSSAN